MPRVSFTQLLQVMLRTREPQNWDLKLQLEPGQYGSIADIEIRESDKHRDKSREKCATRASRRFKKKEKKKKNSNPSIYLLPTANILMYH